jgi:hypothetical protein
LAAPVAVVNEPHALGRSAFMDRQIERWSRNFGPFVKLFLDARDDPE